jgi:hypothetical protein
VASPVATEVPVTSTKPEKVGIFGGQKRAGALLAENSGLAEENQRLRQQVSALLGMNADQQAAESDRLRAQIEAGAERAATERAATERAGAQRARAEALAEMAAAADQLRELRTQVVATDEVAALQEVGIYEYRHPLQDAVAYKSRLAEIKDTLKAMTSQRTAVKSATSWTVNGSVQKGTSMVREVSKLMLRAYNAEADNCVRTLRPHTLQASVTRLTKARDTIARLGQTMSIQISDAYHRQRILELELTADYLVRQEEEKERIRAERERQKEEEAARRDFEREKTRLLKEQAHYSTALARLQDKGDTTGAAEMQERLTQVAESLEAVDRRAANIRTGYVYVISNIGSFGENMIKIGMTRRLDPRERIRELGDASVPFKFDVHAFIFSEDAVSLETELHHRLEHCRVNQVNRRREFFRTTPAEVLTLLEQVAGSHLMEFTEIPEALEWRATRSALSPAGLARQEPAKVSSSQERTYAAEP